MSEFSITDIQSVLADLPCGGIGEDGPTLEELRALEAQGLVCEGDAVYHTVQRAWRMLDALQPSLEITSCWEESPLPDAHKSLDRYRGQLKAKRKRKTPSAGA